MIHCDTRVPITDSILWFTKLYRANVCFTRPYYTYTKLYFTVLYCAILYCTILYYTIMYVTTLYYATLHFYYTILGNAIPCHNMLDYTIILYCTILPMPRVLANFHICTHTHTHTAKLVLVLRSFRALGP